jgi:hypothetical protein
VGLANPLVGGGFDYYSKEIYEKYFPEFLERWPGKVWSCHSIWYTIFSEHGFLSFFLWIGLLISCFFSLRQMRFYGQIHSEITWITYCRDMLQTALVAFLVVGTFLDAAYFDLFYYFVGIIIILKEIMHRLTIEVPEQPTIAIRMGNPSVYRRTTIGT